MDNLNCKQRIEEHCKSRILEMARCTGRSEASEKRYEEFMENVLSVDSWKVYKVCLSYGGPADYFEIHVQNGEIIEIWYIFQDWYDGARLQLEGKSFDVATRMFSYLTEEF